MARARVMEMKWTFYDGDLSRMLLSSGEDGTDCSGWADGWRRAVRTE